MEAPLSPARFGPENDHVHRANQGSERNQSFLPWQILQNKGAVAAYRLSFASPGQPVR